MGKVLAYTALHYGLDFLWYALESVKDHVDEHLILYTERPSFSYSGQLPNPDTREKLKAVADQFPHVTWLDITAHGEGEHRQKALSYARQLKYDLVLVVDSDEVWDKKYLPKALSMAYNSRAKQFAVRGSQWLTFWKSFNEYVQDGFAPVRVHNLKNSGPEEFLEDGDNIWIYHCGYAIRDELMKYKLSCHGHKMDIPGNWYREKWEGYQKGKTTHLHPATDAYWIETEDYKKQLPEILKGHPYAEF